MKNSIQRGTANRSAHDPRTAALRVIDGALTGKEPSQALLDKALRESQLVPTDKGLCTELVYGYLRMSLRLNWDLGRLLKNPDKLPSEMRLVLGLAAYELAYLRIPAHATVNWAVTRVRNRFGQGLAGVANATLRAFAKLAKKYADESRYDSITDEFERLAVIHAVPAWIVKLWVTSYGSGAALELLKASSGRAVPAVRVNAGRDDAATVRQTLLTEGKGVAVASYGVAFPEGAPYVAKTFERKGRVSFQSAAVQEILEELGVPSWQGPVWDACAGRGGKTAALIERGLDVTAATDLSPGRIAGFSQEMERLSLPLPTVLEADAAMPPDQPPFSNKFATILADVPCSGLGTLTRRPEIRFRRSEMDIAELVQIQNSILDSAASHLLPGGRIVYLTCTLNPTENEERVKDFLTRHSEFSLEKEWATPPVSPWREFFYGAVLRR